MRAIWKGAVAFGLVNVPVRLYAATGEHEVTLHQVHKADGGRIRYRKVCSIDGEEVEYREIAKGFETDEGELVVLTDEDFSRLPLSTEREIEVMEFVPAEQVDPILLGKTYYLEPEKTAAKPYALLRGALEQADRMAVVKVALRQRESMAVLRVRDQVICMQILLWPDEIRAADFPILDADVSVKPQELAMASSLVDSLAADFDPSQYEDRYSAALEQLIETKISTGDTRAVPAPAAEEGEQGGGEVVDLLAALQRSVEKARGTKGEAAEPKAPERAASRKRTGTDDAADGADGADGAASGAGKAGPSAKKPATKRASKSTSGSAKNGEDAPTTPRKTRRKAS
ncbi:non-homologous end joining protein Ku [Cellulomonas biazotea]|uniref:Non-homologous end joining protein Ku n=1 Tax=Cellulomonas biazotea TaxID=1709 RepID=A0A402DLW0_9CELL|nr:Ku protein [Cellulomonas biazotea]GCE75105.1 non-homologous end joining protein Ku [Cellulomonas biazotea]